MGEFLIFCLILCVVAGAGKWFLFLFDRAEWRAVRAREHEAKMANKNMLGGAVGIVRRLLGG